MKLNLRLKNSTLAGYPREYEPRFAVWSTDRSSMDDAAPGMAVAMVRVDKDGLGTNTLSLGGPLPVERDTNADLCIALYTSTRETGYSEELSDAERPNTIRVGQVNIHWLGLMQHFSEGNAGKLKVEAPIVSLAAYDSILYQSHFEEIPGMSSEKEYAIASRIAEKGASRAVVEIVIETQTDEQISTIRHLMQQERIQGELSRADHAERDYDEAMQRYTKEYYKMFPRDGSGRLAYRTVSGKTVSFDPDTPSMDRFHLPMWSSGADRLPFAEWWMVTLNQEHHSDASTEHFFVHLASVGLQRADAHREDVINTVSAAFSPGTSSERRLLYSKTGTPERAALLRAVEATYYTCTSLALSFHYTSDGRYVAQKDGMRKLVKRLQVEDPEQDIVGGASRSGDCEDLEKTIAIMAHLLSRGRGGTKTKSWEDPLLSSMQTIMRHYVTLHTFGSVRGAQLSDAAPTSELPIPPMSSNGPVGYGKQISLGPRDASDVNMERANSRRYWGERFRSSRPWYHRMWAGFREAHPSLGKSVFELMPSHDDSPFWRDIVLWADHYISIRLHLVIERIEREQNIGVVFISDGKLRVYDEEETVNPAFYTQDAFEERYNDSKRLETTWALGVTELDGDLGFGADPWSGEHERYRMFYRMKNLFVIANVLFTWKTQPSHSRVDDLSIIINEDGDLQDYKISAAWFLETMEMLIKDVKTYGPPQEAEGRVTIMSRQPVVSRIASDSHVLYSEEKATRSSNKSKDSLSADAVVLIEQQSSVDELRRNMTSDVKREARNRPRAFWRTAIMTYYSKWNDRFMRVFSSLAGQDLDDDLLRHLSAREEQYGAYNMWRNGAMWLEWFHDNIEGPQSQSVALWWDGMIMQRDEVLHNILENLGPSRISPERREEAERISQALLYVMGLADHFWFALDANYVKEVYRTVVRALGALGSSPTVFRNEREKSSLMASERIHYKFPRYRPPHEKEDDVKRAVAIGDQRHKKISDLACRQYPELSPSVSEILKDMPETGDTLDADTMRVFSRNLRGWMHVYVRGKTEFLVRNALRRSPELIMQDPDKISVGKSGKAMNREEFLSRFYHGRNIGHVSLSTKERLGLYSRLRQTEPEGADILIALDHLLSESKATPKGGNILAGERDALVGNLFCELRDFDPHRDRTTKLFITVAGMHAADETTCGDMVAKRLSLPDILVIDYVASLPTMDIDRTVYHNRALHLPPHTMWEVLRSNRYLSSIEESRPFVFWMRVLKVRLPFVYERARDVLGETALQRFGLPDRDDEDWRNMIPWLSFYMKELFDSHIQKNRLALMYRYIDLNVIQSTWNKKLLTFEEYIKMRSEAGSVQNFMHAGMDLCARDYDEDTHERMRLMNAFFVFMFADEEQREEHHHRFKRIITLTSNVILRSPSAPKRKKQRYSLDSASHRSQEEPEADSMLIDNRADHEMNIGGHMFALFAPTIHIDTLYRQHGGLMDDLCGSDGPHKTLSSHVRKSVLSIAGKNTTDDEFMAAERLCSSLPVLVGEGTGPQELMLRPLGDYFSTSEELLKRSSSHIVSSNMLEAWHEDGNHKMDATIYGFQKHLFSDEMQRTDPISGTVYERRLSSFYRRLGHSCSYELNEIDPRFGHLFWVRPQRMHYGANLRHFVEGGDALPLPAPRKLADTYRGNAKSCSSLYRKGRHVIPYLLKFDGTERTLRSSTDISSEISIPEPPYSVICEHHVNSDRDETLDFNVTRGNMLASTIDAYAEDNSIDIEGTGAIYIPDPTEREMTAIKKRADALYGNYIISREKLIPSSPTVVCIRSSKRIRFSVQQD